MTKTSLVKCCLMTGTLFLSSCAYMQTHKNIEEGFREHTGYTLSSGLELYRAGGAYYLAAQKKQLRIHYPVIYDSIFLSRNNDPEYRSIGNNTECVYRQISTGTALVLQRADGYADLNVVRDELQNNAAQWLTSLPANAQKCKINAEIIGTSVTWPEAETATEAPLGIRVLSTTDQVLVDWPGTLLYNIAIPVMAPFVFFHEFLNEQ